MEYIPAKTIVTRTKSRDWFGLDYNMNIYKGCCHGCIYCDSRSDCYRIEDFDTVRAKENALQIIRDELRRKVKKGVVGTGSMSDPYNPFEKELLLTRHSLELLDAFGFGAAIATKSTLLARDIDVLESIREHSPVLCKVTVTTADDALARKVEPGAPVSSERFELLSRMSERGLFAGILLMPVLPFLEDNRENVLAIVRHAAECGVRFIYPAFGMTLRGSQRLHYYQKLEEAFPGQELVGRYRKQYGEYYECRSHRAGELYRMLEEECAEYGILYRMKDIVHAYRQGYDGAQLNLFDIYN